MLAVDGQHQRDARRQWGDLRERVGDARALGELGLELVAARALPDPCEQPHRDLHLPRTLGVGAPRVSRFAVARYLRRRRAEARAPAEYASRHGDDYLERSV